MNDNFIDTESPFVDFTIDETPTFNRPEMENNTQMNGEWNELFEKSTLLEPGQSYSEVSLNANEIFDGEGFNNYSGNFVEDNEDSNEAGFINELVHEISLDDLISHEYIVGPDKGITDYLNVSAVKNRSLKTGVFIPTGYRSSGRADIIVYLHGLFADGDRANGIEYYWKNYSNIRDYFYTSRRNAILIAPTLSSNPQNEGVILNQRGGLDKFLTACLTELQVKNYLPPESTFNNIIIAAHSAGGRPLARIVSYPGIFNEKIIECWGFDCLYAEWWANNISAWAKNNKRFYHYWAWSCSPKHLNSCPKVIGDKIKDNPNVQNIEPIGKIKHQQVIENAWLYPIINRSWFEKIQEGAMSPSDESSQYSFENTVNSVEAEEYFNEIEDFLPDLAKALKLNSYYAQSLGWNQYRDRINDLVLPFSGQQNVSLGEEAFAEAVSAWQRRQGFSVKDSDGVIGPATWKKMQTLILAGTPPQNPSTPPSTVQSSGFTFSRYALSTSEIVIQARDDRNRYAEVRKAPSVFLKEIVRNAGEDPQRWFDRFTKITFLGRSLKGDQYVQESFAIHLKQLEKKLALQFGGPNADPNIAGDTLMLTHEGISGSRLVSSSATFSYHMFGLAVDINYTGCPYIQPSAHNAFNAFMGKVAKLVANAEIKGIDWGISIPATSEKYLKLYDDFSILNNYLKKYFSFLEPRNEPVLSLSLKQCRFSPWNGFDLNDAKGLIKKDLSEIANAWKGSRSNPEDIFKNGFLNLSRDFVKGMVESGLDWGARYGDIMHFDMRTAPGIGSRIENAKNSYISATKVRAREVYSKTNNEDFASNEENLDSPNFMRESNPFLTMEEETSPTPKSVPAVNPVPFAPVPPLGSYWPIQSQTSVSERLVSYETEDGRDIVNSSRKFLANRATSNGDPRYHVGIDLYAKFNEPVVACDDGQILSFRHFYTTSGGNATNSLVVKHSNVIVNYGEIGPSSLGRLNLSVGSTVRAGQIIGFIGATNMLHFETYRIDNTTTELPPHRWMKNEPSPPRSLYNPTKYLLFLKHSGLPQSGAMTSPATPISSPVVAVPQQLPDSVRLNRYYADTLGWNQFYIEINDFLLPFAGMQNVSLNEEEFAKAVLNWQRSQGFSMKNCDGIIGPETWKIMRQFIRSSFPASVNPSTIPTSGSTNSLETMPGSFSSEQVPSGFRKNSYNNWSGLDRKSIIRVDDAAKKINASIPLRNYGITETDIDTFQRLANAETGGHIQNFYSLDMAIVSMGFRQFTFIHGNIHNWINKVPAAFKRYGIEIDDSLSPYTINRVVHGKNQIYTVKRIKGVDDPETLRWNGWAQRFYYAGLDYEIIIAEFLLAKETFASEIKKLKGHLASDQFVKFMSFYNQSSHLRAFFHELNNALPAYVPSPTKEALNNTVSGQNGEQFLQNYFQSVKASWPDPAQAQRILDNTKNGAKVKVFDNELTNIESYEDVGSKNDSEIEFYEAEPESSIPEYSFNEFDSFVQDLSNAIRLNRSYGESLGWIQFYDQINELVLPFSGHQNVSLGEESFAQAVAEWQRQQGFSEKDSDGILGPNTWRVMQRIILKGTNIQVPQQPATGDIAPSVNNILDFNQWHARKILDNMANGIIGQNFDSKNQLKKIANGEQVLNVNPQNKIIQVLPFIYHISEQARLNNYREIAIGSFIRGASGGKCTGHCEGRCIDINHTGGSFESTASAQMVINILKYLLTMPLQYKKNLGFGMPLQGDFFGPKNLTKFKSANPSNLINSELKALVTQLGYVFPDNNNHLHIQVKWL